MKNIKFLLWEVVNRFLEHIPILFTHHTSVNLYLWYPKYVVYYKWCHLENFRKTTCSMLQNEEYHCNTSPAAVTAHIDYETQMILFIVDFELRLWCREHRS